MDINDFLESIMVEEGIDIDIKKEDKVQDEPKKKKREIINDPPSEDRDPAPLKPVYVNNMKGGLVNDEDEDLPEEIDEADDEEEVTDEPAPEEEIPAEPEADPGMEGGDDMGADPDMGGDAGMGDMDGGFGQEEDPNDPENASEVGRMHELKKIHSRLSSLDMYLSSMLDPKLIRLKELVSKSRDLFHTVVSNFGMYKENIDEIIVTYYKFLDEVFELLVKYYKSKKDAE